MRCIDLLQVTSGAVAAPVWLAEALLAHAAVEGQHKALRRTLQLLAALPPSQRLGGLYLSSPPMEIAETCFKFADSPATLALKWTRVDFTHASGR